jgi:hypothetical protein
MGMYGVEPEYQRLKQRDQASDVSFILIHGAFQS